MGLGGGVAIERTALGTLHVTGSPHHQGSAPAPIHTILVY
jgi:hypothetical protein